MPEPMTAPRGDAADQNPFGDFVQPFQIGGRGCAAGWSASARPSMR
jgi:hypothetical protein